MTQSNKGKLVENIAVIVFNLLRENRFSYKKLGLLANQAKWAMKQEPQLN